MSYLGLIAMGGIKKDKYVVRAGGRGEHHEPNVLFSLIHLEDFRGSPIAAGAEYHPQWHSFEITLP